MTTIVLIKEAIATLKDRTGSSVVAINKWIESEKKVSQIDLCEKLSPTRDSWVRSKPTFFWFFGTSSFLRVTVETKSCPTSVFPTPIDTVYPRGRYTCDLFLHLFPRLRYGSV